MRTSAVRSHAGESLALRTSLQARTTVFDHPLPLTDVAEGYSAMGERRAIKTLLRV
jgi:hypothetical protein